MLCLVFLWFCPCFWVLDFYYFWFVFVVGCNTCSEFFIVMLFGFCNSACSIFLLIWILPYLLVLLGICSGVVLCVVIQGEFFCGFYQWLWCIRCIECKGWFYTVFGVVGIVGCLWVCGRYLWWFGHLHFSWGCLKMVVPLSCVL